MTHKPSLPLSLLIALAAGAAVAKADPPVAAATPAPASASPAPAAASGNTVGGVTVMPLPQKACAPKDKDCVALVIAELKQLYPEQLKTFCFQQKMTVLRRDMQANIAGWCTGAGQGAASICSHYVPPVVKQACESDLKK